MILKAKWLLTIFLFLMLFCIFGAAIIGINNTTVVYAAQEISVSQNTNEVFYSAKNYIVKNGENSDYKLDNFSSVQGVFSNAIYDALDIRINNIIESVDPNDIFITNQTEIKIAKVYKLNLKILFGGEEYIVTNVTLTVKEKSLDVSFTQITEVNYNAKSYIENGCLKNLSTDEQVFTNSLYDAISFKIGGNTVTVDKEDIFFYNLNNEKIMEMKKPNSYNLNILFEYQENSYLVKSATIVISKSVLNVSVELNGVLNLTIEEGEIYFPRIVYSGFLGSDNVNSLSFPATMPNEPKFPIDNYEIRAEGALSDCYQMNYISSYITITANPLEEITYSSAGEDLIILRGKYSPYCELEFVNVGINEASVIYAEIKNKLTKNFESSGIFDDYKEIGSYRVNLKVDGQKQ